MKYAFKDIASNCTEKRIPTEEDRLTYIGLEHLDSRKLAITRYGSDVPLKGEKLVMKKGDILFGKRNTYLKRVAIAPFDGLFSAHGMVLRPNEKVISKEFFPFFLSSDYFLDEAIRISVGSLSPTVNWKDLRDLEFEIPDFDKQHELALFLSSANELKESYEKMIAATDEMVKSQFIEMFGTISGNTPLSLGDFFSMKAGKSITAEDIKLDQEEDLYPCYGGNGVRGYVTSYTHEGDTVLIGRQGALCGNVQIARNKFYATEHAVVVTPKTPVNISWLYYALKSMELNQYARGVAQPGLAVGQLEKLPFVLPSMKSQNEFARVSHQADKSKFELKQAIEKIDKVMRALMQ